jgi:hypothetical protein
VEAAVEDEMREPNQSPRASAAHHSACGDDAVIDFVQLFDALIVQLFVEARSSSSRNEHVDHTQLGARLQQMMT